MNFNQEAVIKRIKEIQSSKLMNQKEFAELIHVNQPDLSSYLSGKKPFGMTLINRISLELSINKEWLLTGEGEMYKQLSAEEEFAFLIGHIAASDNPKLKNLINILSQIDNEQDLDLILNLCKRLSDKKEV